MDDDKITKTEYNNRLKKMSILQLQKEAQELSTDIMVMENKTRAKQGTSLKVRNYPIMPYEGKFGNIKKMKKDLARIKTFLNIKLLQQ